MKISVMRRIDYLLGIPICFLLSVFNAIIRKIIKPKGTPEKIKKVLFLELSEIGSAIMSFPAMKKIKDLYPDSELYFWIFKSNEDAIHILNIMPKKNVITLRTQNFSVLCWDMVRSLIRIWKERIDVVVDMELFSRLSSILIYLTGAPVRIGFHRYSTEGLYRGNLHTHNVLYNPYKHIAANFLSLVYALRSPLNEVPLVKRNLNVDKDDLGLPKLRSDENRKMHIYSKLKERDQAINENSKIVVMHPSINDALPIRRWAFDNYLKLSKLLLEDQEVFVIMVGTLRGELEQGIGNALKVPRVINLIGDTSIEELIDLFNISRILISHDSGIIHIASLTDLYILALFGPETPVLYEPLTANKYILYKNYSCSPCLSASNQRVTVCNDNKCLQAITLDEVAQKAKEIIR